MMACSCRFNIKRECYATLIEMNVPSWQDIARLINAVLFNPN